MFGKEMCEKERIDSTEETYKDREKVEKMKIRGARATRVTAHHVISVIAVGGLIMDHFRLQYLPRLTCSSGDGGIGAALNWRVVSNSMCVINELIIVLRVSLVMRQPTGATC